jgi:hypothetical protein
MTVSLTATVRHRLENQGFVGLEERLLAEAAPWLRFTPAVFCALLAVATVAESPILLVALTLVATLGAAQRVHPFDSVYNNVLRYFTVTRPLPVQRAPRRFASALNAALILAVAWTFRVGHNGWGFALGGALFAEEAATALTHLGLFCTLYVLLFGRPEASAQHRSLEV